MNMNMFPPSMKTVRAGIILYGLTPSGKIDAGAMSLRPALEWRSLLSFAKRVPAGRTIGYGRTFSPEREIIVGTVPLGYADGYSRALSNKASVIVRGKRAPVIGRVCMDQFMIDLTDVPGARPGDEVVLIGRRGEREITADELASLQNTINYEIICGISKRVKRVYIPTAGLTLCDRTAP
jgi:alanine racemase